MADTAKAGKASLLIHIHTPSTAPFPCRGLEGTQKGSQILSKGDSHPLLGWMEPHTRWPLHLPAPELRALWKSISATKKHPGEKNLSSFVCQNEVWDSLVQHSHRTEPKPHSNCSANGEVARGAPGSQNSISSLQQSHGFRPVVAQE